jgi:hypothetical protein
VVVDIWKIRSMVRKGVDVDSRWVEQEMVIPMERAGIGVPMLRRNNN